MKQTIVDQQGIPIAEIGSVQDDLPGRVVHETAQDMQLAAPTLAHVLRGLRSRLGPSVDDILDCLQKSPAFPPDSRSLLRVGLQAYFEQKFVEAVHVLVPQIERGVRVLAALVGAGVLTPARGVFEYRMLRALLQEPLIEEALTARVTHYLRTLLTDQRGWNLRNNVCHALVDAEACNAMAADRLFHALLVLGLLREKKA